MLINLIVWIVLGFLAGYVAKAILPGPDGGGFILTTILGIVGAVVGGWIGGTFFGNSANINDQFSVMALIFSIIGAVVILAIYRLATGRRVA